MARTGFTPERRLRILQQAKGGLSVSRVCSDNNISRTLFYRWKERFEREGLVGLEDRDPRHKSDTRKTAPETVDAIIWAARNNPYLSCRDLAKLVSASSRTVSYSKVQSVLREAGLATKEQRWLAVEDAYRKGYSKFSRKTLAFVVARNPSFLERHLRTYRPGENVVVATFTLPNTTPFANQTFVAVIDAYSSFAVVGPVSKPRDAHKVVDQALDRLSQSGWSAAYLFTDRSAPFSYRNADFAAVLRRRSVQHVAGTRPGRGFAESLRQWIVDRLRENPSHSGIDSIVAAYNAEFAALGFPNYGWTPHQIFSERVSTMIKHKPNLKRKRP